MAGSDVYKNEKTNMTKKFQWAVTLSILVCLVASAQGQRIDDKQILDAMEKELVRSMEYLADQPEPPFYMSYEVTDNYQASVRTMFGEVATQSEAAGTNFDIDLRVGDPMIDNTHERQSYYPNFHGGSLSSQESIQNTLWLLTDETYKAASESLTRIRTRKEMSISETDSADFTNSIKVSHHEPDVTLEFEADKWAKRASKVSSVFKSHPHLYGGTADVRGFTSTRYFVNSETSRIKSVDATYTFVVSARTRADDGAVLSLTELFHARDLAGLPSDKELTDTAEDIVTKLIELRQAPKVEPYTGPAILSGRASGVLFHEILGHRLEGHRLKLADEGQTFKDKVDEYVLPPSFSVIFDPSIRTFGETDLLGYYAYDNEGVAGQRVDVITNGILEHFLFGRSTVTNFPVSNGHGRKAIGYHTVARQSNMLVQVENPLTTDELEAQLIELLKERNLEYGLYFDDIVGGYTITSRSLPNVFNVQPVIVYKIYQDGTRELIRGVDLIGTPLAVFDSVIAAADDLAVFNGQCGAESGNIPVSAIAPSMLVGQIEVQRTAQSRAILPILPPPVVTPPEA